MARCWRIGNQFLGFALFDGAFFVDSFFPNANAPLGVAILAYLFEAAVIIAFGLLAFRLTQVRKIGVSVSLALRAPRTFCLARIKYRKHKEVSKGLRAASQLLCRERPVLE